MDRLACVRASSYSPMLGSFLGRERLEDKELDTLIHLMAVDDHQMYTCLCCISDCPLV